MCSSFPFRLDSVVARMATQGAFTDVGHSTHALLRVINNTGCASALDESATEHAFARQLLTANLFVRHVFHEVEHLLWLCDAYIAQHRELVGNLLLNLS